MLTAASILVMHFGVGIPWGDAVFLSVHQIRRHARLIRLITGDVNFGHWLRWYPPWFSHQNLFFLIVINQRHMGEVLCNYVNILIILHARFSWFLPENIITLNDCQLIIFSTSIIACTFISWLSTPRRTFPFSFHFFFLSLLYQYDSWVLILFNGIKYIAVIYLDAQTILHLVRGSPLWVAPVSFVLFSPSCSE